MSTTRIDSNRKISNISDPAILDQMIQEGDRLGHCKVMSLIAAGGMANVFKVWHEQLEVVRAIKILKPGFSDESRGRLETEAKISANLRHGNIVEIYGMGYWNSIPYIEMEYIDGPSLKDLIEQYTRLPVPFSIAVCHYVCAALQYAYNRDMTLYGKVYDGLIHRDIKPANILITSQGKIKLADFGIARPSEVSLHTVGTKVMGTFAYLSPEQLNGEKLDQRSDVYSLGAVLYEMITGVKTFPQKLLAELIQKKTKGYFVPLESTGLQIPKNLCNIVEKSLCLDKNRRYSDADDFDHELMSALKRFSNHIPEDIVRDFIKNPYSSSVSKSIQRKKTKGTVFYIVAGILIIALCVTFFLYHKTEKTENDKPIEQKSETIDTINNLNMPVVPQATIKNIPPKIEPKIIQPQQDTQVSIFLRGCKAFEEKDYNIAISLFNSISVEKLNNQQQGTLNLNLLQSYIIKNDFERALNIANSTHSNNAQFHFLRGELYSRFKRYDEASLAFETAQQYTHSTLMQKKIILQKARISEARFMMKPNRDNKQLCFKAWSTFTSEFCTGTDISPDCNEAQKKVLQYSE